MTGPGFLRLTLRYLFTKSLLKGSIWIWSFQTALLQQAPGLWDLSIRASPVQEGRLHKWDTMKLPLLQVFSPHHGRSTLETHPKFFIVVPTLSAIQSKSQIPSLAWKHSLSKLSFVMQGACNPLCALASQAVTQAQHYLFLSLLISFSPTAVCTWWCTSSPSRKGAASQ